MPGSYLDEIYGLLPNGYGSDASPMNMEAMDVRPEAVRLDDEARARRAAAPQRIEPPLGADYPEGSRVDLGDGTERVYGPNGTFEVRQVPTATVDFGDMTPPSGRAEKRGNVEYIYGGEEPDMTGVNRPRAAPAGQSPPVRPNNVASGGPPLGVVPPGGTPSPAGQDDVSVDAISGAGGQPVGPEAPTGPWSEYLEQPQAGRKPARDTRESLMGEERNSPVPEDVSQIYERELSRQAALTPEQRVAENARREFERQQQGVDEMAALAAKGRVEAQQNLDSMLAARKKSQEEIDRLKAQPGWWERRSTGQKVATYAGAIFAGMLSGFQGSSRNIALESMQHEIEKDAEERAAEYAQARQGMVDADELYKVKELVLLRGMEEAKGMILTHMAQYDKNGSMAAAGMAAVQDLKARQADAEMKVLEHNWKKELELRKMSSDELQTAARLKQEDVNSRRSAGVQYAQIASQERLAKEGTQGLKEAAELENTRARTENARLEAQDKANAITGGPGGNPYAFGDIRGNPYVQKDGSVFAVKDEKRRERIDNLNNASINVRRMADLVKIMRESEGGASSAVGSPAYQELRSLAAQTDFETYKAFGLGAPSAGDQQLAQAVRGGKDITSFLYSPEAGFQSYAEGLEDKLDTSMRSAGYTGKKINLPRSRTPTDEDLALERARSMSPGSFVGGKFKKAAEEGAKERGGEPDYAPVYDEPETPPGWYGGE